MKRRLSVEGRKIRDRQNSPGLEGASKDPRGYQSTSVPEDSAEVLVAEGRGILTANDLIQLRVAPFAWSARPHGGGSSCWGSLGGRGKRSHLSRVLGGTIDCRGEGARRGLYSLARSLKISSKVRDTMVDTNGWKRRQGNLPLKEKVTELTWRRAQGDKKSCYC